MPVFTVIDHTEIGAGGAASWTKASIPASYDHLYMLASLRTERADYFEDGKIYLNGDTGSNYAYVTLRGGSGVSGASSTGDHSTQLRKWNMAGASAAAGTFGTISMWIPNYAGTVGWKPLILNWGVSTANTAVSRYSVGEFGGLWYDTSAIDEITILTNDGEDIAQYSTFTLYGVTGA
jgi:hypothetical protein